MKKFFIIGIVVVSCALLFMANEKRLDAFCVDTITISQPSLDFGNQAIYTTSAEQTVQVEFPGGCSAQLTNLTLSITGMATQHFRIASTDCGTTLASGVPCNASIVFKPKATGDFTSGASFVVSAEGSDPVNISIGLSGVGTPPDAGTLALLTGSKDSSDGCNATASTGAAGRTSAGPAALGLVALMGLVLGTAAVRRRVKKH